MQTRPFLLPRLRVLVCKLGATGVLASEAFWVKGSKGTIDIGTWHVTGTQINGGCCDYDRAQAMPAAKEFWAGIGRPPVGSVQPLLTEVWASALPGPESACSFLSLQAHLPAALQASELPLPSGGSRGFFCRSPGFSSP